MTFVSDVARNVGDYHGASPTSGATDVGGPCLACSELPGIGGGVAGGTGAETPVADRSTIGNGPQRGGRPLPTFPSGKELKRMECRER